MYRKIAQFASFLVLALALPLGVTGAEEKTPSIKDIMKASFGKTGFCGKCAAAGKDMKWEDAIKLGKQLSDCVANLPKNKCPKGEAESWEKLSKEFAAQAAAVSAAAEKKDAKEFQAAIGTFTKSCKACHDAHRTKK